MKSRNWDERALTGEVASIQKLAQGDLRVGVGQSGAVRLGR